MNYSKTKKNISVYAVFMFLSILMSPSVYGQNWNEVLKAVASDREAGDQFGVSVCISGDRAIIGASSEDDDVAGGNTLSASGSAYIFEKDLAGDWVQVQKIVASDRGATDLFGRTVAISGDYVVVGAPWEGEDLDGLNTMTVAGSAYIFERDVAGVWSQVQKIVPSDRSAFDEFGTSVAISGGRLIVGAVRDKEDENGLNPYSYAGSAYIFERDGAGVWNQVQKIAAPVRISDDYFGVSVGISGDFIVVGAHGEDQNSMETGSIYNTGSAYVFERDGAGVWNYNQKITASDRAYDNLFGWSVDISGDYIIAGAMRQDVDVNGANNLTHAGAAYIFEKNGAGSFIQVDKLVASDRGEGDQFGYRVSIDGEYAIVGAYLEDHNVMGLDSLDEAGSAYVFKRNSVGNWIQTRKLVPQDRAESDNFGCAVSVSGSNYLIGANDEDEDQNGANTLGNAGSSYFFEGATFCSPSTSSFTISACNEYTVPSGDETYTFTGTQVVMDTIPNYCGVEDSVMTITLSIYPVTPAASTLNETICFGESITVNGTVYDQDVTGATEVFSNVGPYDYNCDSTVTINLTVLPEKTGYISRELCYGESVSVNGTTYNTSTLNGVEVIQNVGPYSCDSTVLVNTVVSPQLFDSENHNWNNVVKQIASDRKEDALYGHVVDIWGDYAIVGASLEPYDQYGANMMDSAGAAYVLQKNQLGNWVEAQKLVPSDRSNGDRFGTGVAISGSYAIIGANRDREDADGLNPLLAAGSAYIFKRQPSGAWVEVQKITPSVREGADFFGEQVDITDDYAIVGVEGRNSFGVTGAGAAYIFKRDDETDVWNEQQEITASDYAIVDRFGSAVAIYDTYAAVGASSEDHDAAGGNYMNSSGSVYMFELDNTNTWAQTQKIVASDRYAGDGFGETLAMSGNKIIVGSPSKDNLPLDSPPNDEGAAYIFERNIGGVWSQVDKLVASDLSIEPYGRFGLALDISACMATVGTLWSGYDGSGGNYIASSGGAYVFQRKTTGNWDQAQKIVAPDRQGLDHFATSIGISGNQIIVGTPLEDHDLSGNNFMSRSGSVYIFEGSEPCVPLNSTISEVACNSYTAPDGQIYTSSGQYTATVQNANGCDSTITINLIVQNGASTSTIAPVVCMNYTAPDGQTYTSSGQYTATIPNYAGCDSVITINLTVGQNTSSTINANTCAAASYTAPDGQVYTSNGQYFATIPNVYGCDSTITINLTIGDNTPPVPDDVSLPDLFGECEITSIAIPSGTDNCTYAVVTPSLLPPYNTFGQTTITWTYEDVAGNTTTMNQNIYISDNSAPVPDVVNLPQVNGTCEVTSITPPTATDNCSGSITGTTTTTFPITSSTTVIWNFDDGNGNVAVQTQNIVVSDVTPPVADLATLPDVVNTCEVTSIAAPTATDNCSGSITGTTATSFPITSSTTVTWTFNDGNGNVSTQNQSVVINDNVGPVANVVNLPDILQECALTSLTAPTATDNCSGTVLGFHNAILPITAQGTTIVTWTYTDDNGNTTTQTQNVVIADGTAPVADEVNLSNVTGECEVSSITAPTATDNCVGSVTGTTSTSFPITSSTTVTWTFDDGNGNTSTQTQDVVITPLNNGVSLLGVTISAMGGGYTYQWIDCDNSNIAITGETGQNFTAGSNGSYAVIVSNGSCSDTSVCVTIDEVDLFENDFSKSIVVSPNPTFGDLTINLGDTYGSISIKIIDMVGRTVYEKQYTSIDLIDLKLEGAPGMYMVHIDTDLGTSAIVNVVKE